MTGALPESLAQLNLTIPVESNVAGAKAKPRRCPTYVPPAARHRTLFFGYNVPIRWVWAYARQNLKPRPQGYNEIELLLYGIDILKRETGIMTLHIDEARKPTDTQPPAHLIHWENEAIPILTICSSEDFKYRPTREQVDKLSGILDNLQTPRWWTSIRTYEY
ncbi:hypothetical protein BOTBODRAFT_63373 [Botryobasidium botryosum FD-172 SS1]|uniref:Uncharacterized protein n=1 Tax=Botryobasidium botryosum (strain FD-172 SS1) TaxID=930990 RepID=A0A067MRM3_BOTB1|nr:hypothetical protein BOTBODRAFT_63373 [Botryobasidium botryosum FD-172 SS1]